MKLYKNFVKIFLVVFFILIASPLVTSAQNPPLRCYIRRLNNPDINCSLCDDLTDEQIADLKSVTSSSSTGTGFRYDPTTCTLVSAGSTCDGLDDQIIETRASNCYQAGNFWNDSVCECIDYDTATGIVDPVQVNTTTSFMGLANRIFFRTNFDGSIDDVSELIRLAFILVFTIIAVVAFFLGIYGMYLYSTALDDDEKIQTAQKIFKNALIGIAIALMGIVLVQVVSLFLGVDTEDLFTFNVSNTQ